LRSPGLKRLRLSPKPSGYEMAPETQIVIGLGVLGFVVNTLVLAITGVNKLTQTETSIRSAITSQRENIDDEFLQVRREWGETVSAIRQKVTDVELYVRDNYVRKDVFDSAMTNLGKHVEQVGDRIEARLLRIETKMDKRADKDHED